MASSARPKSQAGGELDQRPSELDRVVVEYDSNGHRYVHCFCGERIPRSIVRHFSDDHAEKWASWVRIFIVLRGRGYPLKKIMRTFKAGDGKLLFTWGVIEREIRELVEMGSARYRPPPKLAVSSWQPEDFQPEQTTVWDFPRRGDWAVHSGDYRGNWPPQVPRNLIDRYTKPGQWVVDAFAGGGTTLIEAWLMGRRSIGIDISKMATQTTNAKLREMERLARNDSRVNLQPRFRPKIVRANSLRLDKLAVLQRVEGKVQLLCAHPPYLDSLPYTGRNGSDLSRIHKLDDFYRKMGQFSRAARIVLAPNGRLAVLVGDVRKNGRAIPLADGTLHAILDEGFDLEATVIKGQHRDRSSEFYYGRGAPYLLMAHEYLFVFTRRSET